MLRTATAATLLLGLLTVPPLAAPAGGSPAPESAPERRATPLTLAGPDEVAIGDRVHLIVAGGPSGAAYTWDTDGDGRFETSTGAEPSLALPILRGGPATIAVRAGGETAELDVDVVRPDVARLLVDPVNPRPGEKVTFRVAGRSDSGGYVAYAWDVEGVAPARGSTLLDTPPGLPGGVELALSSAGTGYQVTTKPELTVVMPKGDQNRNRVISVQVKPISESGAFDNLERTLKLRPLQLGGPDPYAGKGVIDCTAPPGSVPATPCASIGVFSDGLQGAALNFQDVTPGVEACYPVTDKKPEVKQTRITELKNLGYPPPEKIVGGFEIVTVPGVGRAVPAPPATPTRKGEEECSAAGAFTRWFDFGDGTKMELKSGDSSKGYVYPHTYAEPGVYTVTMRTEVPYLTSGKKKDSFLKLKRFPAVVRTKVTIGAATCEPLQVGAFTATAVYDLGRGPDLLGTPCFIGEEGLDGRTLYRPELGYDVELGDGLFLDGEDVLVDPENGLITSSAMGAFYPTGEGGTGGRSVMPVTNVLQLSDPVWDPALGASVLALPARTDGSSTFAGLDVAATQAFLRTDGPALLAIHTTLPAPLHGATPPIVLSGSQPWTPPATTRAGRFARAAEADLPILDHKIDLSGMEVGGFEIKEGVLGHKLGGGWIASVVLEVPKLGTLNAPYKPPPTGTPGSDCETIDGPSGLQLDQDGGFDFGGAQLRFDEEIPLGPAGAPFAGLSCIAATATGEPFVIVGKVGASVPKDGILKVDGCLAFGILDAGQTGAGCDESFVAPGDLVWLRATGAVKVFDLLTLGSAYVDLRIGGEYAAASLGGGAFFDYSIFNVEANVDGTVVFAPDFAFSLIGRARICGDFGIDLCGNVQAGVSSRGFGGCFDLGGIVYRYGSGWDVFYASCDLKAYIGVQKQVAQRRADSATVTMPAGLEQAAFEVHAQPGRPARLQLIAPDGTTIEDDGNRLQQARAWTITKFLQDGVTTVTVTGPAAGEWTVRAQPQQDCSGRVCTPYTPAIEVKLLTPIPDPVVTGEVTGTGDTRSLAYDVEADPGDRVVLVEEGATGPRLLGALDPGSAVFQLPTSGLAGPRTVTAVVERNGVPYRTIELDTYQAPAIRPLSAPKDLTLLTDGGDTSASWRAVPGASGYVVSAVLADGRTVRRVVTGTSVVLRGVTGFTAGRVSVVATDGVGRDSAPGQRRLSPVTRVVRGL